MIAFIVYNDQDYRIETLIRDSGTSMEPILHIHRSRSVKCFLENLNPSSQTVDLGGIARERLQMVSWTLVFDAAIRLLSI